MRYINLRFTYYSYFLLIYYHAFAFEAMHSTVFLFQLCVSVRPTTCLSLTFWYCVKTAKRLRISARSERIHCIHRRYCRHFCSSFSSASLFCRRHTYSCCTLMFHGLKSLASRGGCRIAFVTLQVGAAPPQASTAELGENRSYVMWLLVHFIDRVGKHSAQQQSDGCVTVNDNTALQPSDTVRYLGILGFYL